MVSKGRIAISIVLGIIAAIAVGVAFINLNRSYQNMNRANEKADRAHEELKFVYKPKQCIEECAAGIPRYTIPRIYRSV
jgi:hypothetical protein